MLQFIMRVKSNEINNTSIQLIQFREWNQYYKYILTERRPKCLQQNYTDIHTEVEGTSIEKSIFKKQ